jgi:hypothetical protein
MIHIERLRLRLPPGFEHRAASIAGLIGDSLAKYEIAGTHNLESLSVGPLKLAPNATDRDVADKVARGIATSLGVNG